MATQQFINKLGGLNELLLLMLTVAVMGCNSVNSLGDPHTIEDYVEGKVSTLGVLTDNPAQATRWGAIAGGGVGIAVGTTQIMAGGWAIPMVSFPLAVAETWIGYTAGAVGETTIERAWDALARNVNRDKLRPHDGRPITLEAIAAMDDAGISNNGIYRFMRDNPPVKPFDTHQRNEIAAMGFSTHLIAYSDRQLRLNGIVSYPTADNPPSQSVSVNDGYSSGTPLTTAEVLDMIVRQGKQPSSVEREIYSRGISDSLTPDEILEWNRNGIPPFIFNAMEQSRVRVTGAAPILDATSFKSPSNR